MRGKPIKILILALALPSLLLGCGYKLMGRGGPFPNSLTSVTISPLENKTKEPNLTSIFTSALRREFIRRCEVAVKSEGADATLKGGISSVRITSLAYDQEGRAREYQISILLDLELVRPSGEIIWQGKGIEGSWHYLASADVMVYEGNKERAIQKIAADLAERAYIMIRERF